MTNFGGTEDLIEFENPGYDDFELRARDIAAFSYLNKHLRIVQNMTVNRYMKISRSLCFVATFLYGPESIEVRLLRQWRDDKLLASRILSRSVTLYYRISPWLVSQFGQVGAFRRLAKWFLAPIVLVLRIRTHNDS